MAWSWKGTRGAAAVRWPALASCTDLDERMGCVSIASPSHDVCVYVSGSAVAFLLSFCACWTRYKLLEYLAAAHFVRLYGILIRYLVYLRVARSEKFGIKVVELKINQRHPTYGLYESPTRHGHRVTDGKIDPISTQSHAGNKLPTFLSDG